MARKKQDRRLIAAMSEIRAVANRYDVAIHVILVSRTHAEFAVGFPTWSVAQFCRTENGKDVGIHVKTDIPRLKTDRQKALAIADALNIINEIGRNAAKQADVMGQVMRLILESMEDMGLKVPGLSSSDHIYQRVEHELIRNPARKFGYSEER